MEILAHRSYRGLDYDVNFWRTNSGLEVDFIMARGEVAVEVKGAGRVHEGIHVLPWREFLRMLWDGAIVS